MRNSYPTQVIGNGALVQKRVISTGFCRLAAVVGQNQPGGADLYIQVHETAAEPSAGSVPLFGFLADAERAYAFALPNLVEMSACTVVASSQLDHYAPSDGTPVTIQALLAV